MPKKKHADCEDDCCGGSPCGNCTGSTPGTMDIRLNGTVIAGLGGCSNCGDFSDAMFTLEHGRGSLGGPDEYPCYWTLQGLPCDKQIQVWMVGNFIFGQVSGSGDTITFSKAVEFPTDCTAEHELASPMDGSGLFCNFAGLTSMTINVTP